MNVSSSVHAEGVCFALYLTPGFHYCNVWWYYKCFAAHFCISVHLTGLSVSNLSTPCFNRSGCVCACCFSSQARKTFVCNNDWFFKMKHLPCSSTNYWPNYVPIVFLFEGIFLFCYIYLKWRIMILFHCVISVKKLIIFFTISQHNVRSVDWSGFGVF